MFCAFVAFIGLGTVFTFIEFGAVLAAPACSSRCWRVELLRNVGYRRFQSVVQFGAVRGCYKLAWVVLRVGRMLRAAQTARAGEAER